MQALPLEVVGWIMKRLRLGAGSWILTLSDVGNLAANIIIRGPIGVNAVWGVTATHTLHQLKEDANVMSGLVKQMDGLPPVQWIQHGSSSIPAQYIQDI
jgi:hypothetical protein